MGRPSVEQSRDKMDDLLRVARHEFIRNGYRSTTMNAIAAAARVAKRTLYLWHKDKAALFLACVLEGARRFPPIDIDPRQDIETGLRDYATALAREFASSPSYGMGILIIREAQDFPELAAAAQATYVTYIVEPLARYLRHHGFEKEGSTDRTKTLIAMMLAEVHGPLLIGGPPPGAEAAERQALVAIDIFLRGGRIIDEAAI